MPKTYSYNKQEKLKSRKLIDGLFTKGKSFSVFPLKVFYMELPVSPKGNIQAGVGVSARNFGKAVDRNRIKRLLREAYRLNKLPVYAAAEKSGKSIAVFFLYLGKELPEYVLINEKMKLAIAKLEEIIA